MTLNTTAVIGAGPYGLSIAAHLKMRGVPTLIFGKPMGFWQDMPSEMYLKSVWSASTLFDPAGKYSLNRYISTRNMPRQEPIPLPLFLMYGQWFQQHVVPDVDPTYVQSLQHDGELFHLHLEDGRIIEANRVVIAVGISSFAYIPDFALHLPQTLATHTQTHRSFTPFAGKSVVIVGSGQSGLESAALLHEVGADVELIVRGSVIWIDRKLYSYTGPAKHIFYPASDVGPPGLNWLIAFPLIFSQFSDKARYLINKRAVRPAGAQWLRSRVEGHVRISLHTQITKVIPQGQRLCLELSDGTVREVDHLFLGTGYKPDINKISFIDQELRQKVQVRNGYPALNRWFESSVPHLYFAGAIAGYTFGPICRFVAGSKVPAQQIALHAVHTS